MTSPQDGGGSPSLSKMAWILEGVHKLLIVLDVLCE